MRENKIEESWPERWKNRERTEREITDSFCESVNPVVEINEGQANKRKQRLFTQTCYNKEVSHHHLNFGRDTKAGNEVRKLYTGPKEGFRYSVIGGCWKGEAVDRLARMVRGVYLAFCGWSYIGNGDKKLGKLLVIHQPSLFWAEYGMSYCIVRRDSNPATHKSDLLQTGFLVWLLLMTGWFTGQIPAGCGSEFYFYRWSVYCPIVYSVFHCHVWIINFFSNVNQSIPLYV